MSPSAVLAQRFQQKWMASHPDDSCSTGENIDDSLTNLAWLQDLRVVELTLPRLASSESAGTGRDIVKQEPQATLPNIASLRTPKTDTRLLVGDTAPLSRSSFDYKSNPYVKPPFSYTSLICMAMQASRKSKITLSSIYSWITDNFVYYRFAEPSWQNSIRHNLSLNKCFEKVARQKDEPGKGGFWRINPEYGDLVENGVLRKRCSGRDTIPSPPKRLKVEEDDAARVSGLKSGVRDDKMLSNGSSDLDTDTDDYENSLLVRSDLTWATILNQNTKINSEEDNQADNESLSFLAMSPPSSETNCADLGLELFSQTDFTMSLPIDFQSNDPLDLTVQGTTIRPPDWWLIEGTSDCVKTHYKINTDCRLSAHLPQSQESGHGEQTWGESFGHSFSGNNFDVEDLFEFNNILNPKL